MITERELEKIIIIEGYEYVKKNGRIGDLDITPEKYIDLCIAFQQAIKELEEK